MKKMKMNKTLKKFMPVIIIAIFIIIPTIIALTIGDSIGGKGIMPQLEVVEVTTDNITQELVVTGTVASEKTKILFSPINGTIDSCTAKVGQAVQKGDVLAAFDLEELESSYKQSELAYKQSQSDYNVAVSNDNELKSEAAEAASEVNSLESSIQTLEANMNSYDSKLEQLTNTQVKLQSEVEEITAQIVKQQAYIQELEEALEPEIKIGTEAETEEVSQKEIQEELQAIQKELTNAEKELSALQKSLEEANKELSTAVSETTSYTKKLETAATELSEKKMSLAENEAIAESGKNAMTAEQLEVLEISNELAELENLDADELFERGKEGMLAPYDGVIASVNVMEGSQVAQGMELITIASNEEVCVDIEVSTDEFDNLEIGNKVEVEIKDYVYEGVVSEMNQIVTTNAMGSNVIGAKIQITNPDENIFLGVEAKSTIVTGEKSDVICIPTSVINTSTEGDFVYVLEDGVVVQKNIEIGISVLDKVEVKSGLEVGEQVISDMATVLYEGMEAEAKSE